MVPSTTWSGSQLTNTPGSGKSGTYNKASKSMGIYYVMLPFAKHLDYYRSVVSDHYWTKVRARQLGQWDNRHKVQSLQENNGKAGAAGQVGP